ncbi:MAG: hypothetical protein KAV87_57065, partial [Desulfobacteraceae bacterium]|nr:hypothetical protein [Desulfobacteraceae bacterium]
IGVVESKKALTSRIKHIVSRPFPKSAKLGFAGLAAIVIIAATLLPMAKANRKDSEVVKIKQDSTSATEFEGKLIFHQDLPVGIIAGTSEHPKLVEIKSIRFESTYGNAWGVTARVGWLPVIDATWKLKVELLDEKGKVLWHPRDEAVVFTGKAGISNQTAMQYVELDLDAMQDQGRRHTVQFHVCLEPVEEQYDVTKTADTNTHTLKVVVVQQENKKPVPDASLVLSSLYIRDSYRREKTLYTTDSQGCCQIRLNAEKLYSPLSVTAQKQGFATMFESFSNYGSSDIGRLPLVNLPNSHIFEMLPASSLGGIIQDKAGNAIEAVDVRFSASLEDANGRNSIRRSVQTDENGRWRVDGVPSEVDRITLGLRHPEYGGDNGRNRRITGEALVNARALKHVETLEKGLTITGKVIDDQGSPIARATVMMKLQSYSPIHALTNVSGEFWLVCADDMSAYREAPTLIVEAPGYAPERQTIDLQLNLGSLEFRLRRGGSVICHVVDTEGRPIVGAWTVIQPLQDYREYGVWLEDTDEQGKFKIPNVPDNDIKLTVGKHGYIAVRDYVLHPARDEVIITMQRALRLQGTVMDAKTGEPIPNFEIATIYSTGGRTNTSSPVAFVEGKYELSFDEARPESRQLQIKAVGYESTVSEEIKIDEGRRVMNFQLARSSDFNEKTAGQPRKENAILEKPRIAGVVRDEKGEPVSGAIVSTRPTIGTETITNDEGVFTLKFRRTSASRMGTTSSREETKYLLVRHIKHNLATAIEL